MIFMFYFSFQRSLQHQASKPEDPFAKANFAPASLEDSAKEVLLGGKGIHFFFFAISLAIKTIYCYCILFKS